MDHDKNPTYRPFLAIIVVLAALGGATGCFEASETAPRSVDKDRVMVKWHATGSSRAFSR